jgi:DNA invertase Pin-like site-specific DNA recombinase
VVHEFSRFARSVKELALALEEFQALGIQFVSLREQIDTTTPAGRLVYHVMAAIAEFERSMVRERVRSGLALRADQLKRDGSFVSKSGQRRYRLGRPRAALDPGYIDQRRCAGASWAEIARELKVSADTCKRAVARTLLVNIFAEEDAGVERTGRDRGAPAKV